MPELLSKYKGNRIRWYVGLLSGDFSPKTARDEESYEVLGWTLRIKKTNWMNEPWECCWGPFSSKQLARMEVERLTARWTSEAKTRKLNQENSHPRHP